MANKDQVKMLRQGAKVWNAWRKNNSEAIIDLTDANLRYADIKDVYLREANLAGAYLRLADLSNADLGSAMLTYADLSNSTLQYADLSNADLDGANLSNADLSDANLSGTDLRHANFSNAKLSNTNFGNSVIGWSIFADNDLGSVKGLETVTHRGPSEISISTMYRSGGSLKENFLRDAGVPDDFITFVPSLFGVKEAIQFYSCFISYSTTDEEFSRRLHSRMRAENLRVWFAPEDIKGGEKLNDQIERAIQMYDRLLLVLSANSMQSNWVTTEILNARRVEAKQNRRKLFPIRLVDFDTIKNWKCFDADTGKDVAVEVREYFIPDFSKWKDYDSFERAFDKLLRDLRAQEDNS